MKQVQFTDEELKALLGLLDAGVRHLGLQGANAAAVWQQKLQAAEELEDEPKTTEKI